MPGIPSGAYTWTVKVVLPGWFYNVGPGRDEGQVEREVRAMLAFRERPTDPAVAELRLVEAIGYHPLPTVPGYELIFDRSTEARANVATYVRSDLASDHRWLDLKGTWPKTDHPGTHAPRSFLNTRVGRCAGVTAHQPPPFTRVELPQLHREGQDALGQLLDPRRRESFRALARSDQDQALSRPRWVAYDANADRNDADPSPKTLARAIGGQLVGSRIDCVVLRGDVECREFEYLPEVRHDGDLVRFLTDHNHALRYVLRVEERWVTSES